MKFPKKSEKGAITVFVGLALVTIMGMSVLVIDAGMGYIRANEIQNAVDAAATSATQYFPIKLSDTAKQAIAIETATDYAIQNGINIIAIDTSKDDNGYKDGLKIVKGKDNLDYIVGMKFAATGDSNTMMAKLLDPSNTKMTITRTAAAEVFNIQTIEEYNDVVPIGIGSELLKYFLDNPSESRTINFGDNSFFSKNGVKLYAVNFDAAQDGTGDSSGVSEMNKDWMPEGYNDTLSINTVHPLQGGNIGSFRQVYNDRFTACDVPKDVSSGCSYTIAACPRDKDVPCTATSHDTNCPRVILVPVVEDIGNGKVKVVSFAQVFIEEPDKVSQDMFGTFLSQATVSQVTGSGQQVSEFTVYGARLTE